MNEFYLGCIQRTQLQPPGIHAASHFWGLPSRHSLRVEFQKDTAHCCSPGRSCSLGGREGWTPNSAHRIPLPGPEILAWLYCISLVSNNVWRGKSHLSPSSRVSNRIAVLLEARVVAFSFALTQFLLPGNKEQKESKWSTGQFFTRSIRNLI